MASIRWTVDARQDLQEIVRYIGRGSPKYAAITAERIVQAVRSLGRYPERGRIVPEYGEPSVRELIVGNYRVIYGLARRDVEILAVVHGSRDLFSRLTTAPWDL